MTMYLSIAVLNISYCCCSASGQLNKGLFSRLTSKVSMIFKAFVLNITQQAEALADLRPV